jgi:hypothetical protein
MNTKTKTAKLEVEILERHGMLFIVKGHSGNYLVDMSNPAFGHCTCDGFGFRKCCRHILKVEAVLRAEQEGTYSFGLPSACAVAA